MYHLFLGNRLCNFLVCVTKSPCLFDIGKVFDSCLLYEGGEGEKEEVEGFEQRDL